MIMHAFHQHIVTFSHSLEHKLDTRQQEIATALNALVGLKVLLVRDDGRFYAGTGIVCSLNEKNNHAVYFVDA